MAQKKTSPSSTSSRASEDSHSDLRQQELFTQLLSASRTPSVRPSSESTGPMSRSTTTSIHATGKATATSSRAATRANLSPSPGSKKARQMTATSGRQCLKLLSTKDLAGSWLKMLLVTSQWASTRCCLTWKAKATPRGRLLYQLAPSMPRTDETGSGLWPTPAAHEARLGYQDRTRGKKGTQKSLTTEVIDDMGGRQATIGQLNPTWVEWLMGFPIGHTDLRHWETLSSRKSSRKSDAQSSQQRARDVR